MLVFVFILIVLICSSLSVAKKNEFYSDYCSQKNTNTINAVFSILIFLSHAVTYVTLDGVLDVPYFAFKGFHGQLVVITYLFFSGFGIMESIKKKGINYVKEMPFKRLFRLWYHFVIVLLLYALVSVGIVGRRFSFPSWILSFIGLKSLGNSNWYMFVTFVLYIIVIVAFLTFKNSNKHALMCVCVLCVGFVILEKSLGMSSRFYNTLLCFPLGMAFSMFKPYIDKIFMKKDIVWSAGLVVSVLLFVGLWQIRGWNLLCYIISTFFALATIVLLMMKVHTSNFVLSWFGRHIFSFFILQRIPMILLREFGYNKNGYFFIVVSFLGAILLSVIFDAFTNKFDSIIFKNEKYKNIKNDRGAVL